MVATTTRTDSDRRTVRTIAIPDGREAVEGHPSSLQSTRRLSLLAMAYALLGAIYVFALPKPAAWYASGMAPAQRLAGFIFLPLALVAAVLLWQRQIRPRSFPVLAFVVEFIGAVGLEFKMLLWPAAPEAMALSISWTAVWITAFPFLVPATPTQTLIGAAAAASVRPLFLGILALNDVPLPEPAIVLQFVIPTYLSIGTAVLGSAVVCGLGREASRAQQMGSYHLIGKLGDGGMGEVWTARHRFLTRTAAIKIVHQRGVTFRDRTKLKRFEREVQAAAQLRSQYTIDIYDYGVTQDGTFYYVMELLDGLDLEKLVRKEGPLQPARVVYILRHVCHSLAEAHAHGIIHRDIKPANIFLCQYGLDLDVAKVLDFGLVKSMHDSAESDTYLTKKGMFYGTPAYASPEVALGEQQQVDARSDIYSLGCVAFWLLTGRPVFQDGTPLAILMKHVNVEPEAPSTYSPHVVPWELDQLVLRCLAKKPGDRVPSAEMLIEELESIQKAHPWTHAMARDAWDRWAPDESAASLLSAEHSHVPTLQVVVGERRSGGDLRSKTLGDALARVTRELLR